MKHLFIAPLMLVAAALHAEPPALSTPANAGIASPDGKFKVVRHSLNEVDKGKPVYTVVETTSGKVLWSASDDFADPARPEDKILWSPDSKRFAIGTRVSVRRISLFILGWNGKTFVEQWKESGKLEEMAGAKALEELQKSEEAKDVALGRCVSDESFPERWIDASSLIVTRMIEHVTVAKGEETGATEGLARVLLRWNAKANAFVITREPVPATVATP